METTEVVARPKRMVPLYQQLAQTQLAVVNCRASSNTEWEPRHIERLHQLVKEHMPSGSGFDSGTTLLLDDLPRDIRAEKLVFQTAFHHMDENGSYDGWTAHTVTVHPSLSFGFTVSVGGRDRNEIKDYIADCFDLALRTEIDANV